ncbi:hypothetical protein RHSIM_Rhsim03G0133400 [Rhododendron simsii]|uniref:Uncharacterized protein n=1 Tax=Rhododendron simsii TaxID=118357 RepID=A0A834HBC7_RHOSS|nr:hypothetical protein RHSIM_Rhsim03G0133400 [Rhododendron simsii]
MSTSTSIYRQRLKPSLDSSCREPCRSADPCRGTRGSLCPASLFSCAGPISRLWTLTQASCLLALASLTTFAGLSNSRDELCGASSRAMSAHGPIFVPCGTKSFLCVAVASHMLISQPLHVSSCECLEGPRVAAYHADRTVGQFSYRLRDVLPPRHIKLSIDHAMALTGILAVTTLRVTRRGPKASLSSLFLSLPPAASALLKR